MTKQRAVILDIIRDGAFHRTADEIFAIAKVMLPGISRATVYNNLHALCEERIIRKISGDGGADRYDRAYEPHGHLFCTSCRRIYDFDIPDFNLTLSRCSDAVIDSYELVVKGVCRSCNSKSL